MGSTIGSRQNWESLRVFAACAEHGSFTAAADELGLTQAAVSQRIAQLEARLGVPLFIRRPRLRLTDAGARLAPRLALGFSAIERALLDIRTPRLLSVTTTVSFATLWLLPRLPQFRRLDPETSIALDIADEYRSLEDDRYDLAIRGVHEKPGPALHAHHLFPIELTPFVSRQLLPPEGTLTVESLARMPLVPEEAWNDWFRAAGVSPPSSGRRGQLLVRNQHLILEAVLAGEGAGLLTPRFVAAHVASGRVARPFQLSITEGDYYLVCRAERADDPVIRGFSNWVSESVAASN
jgi:LysR family transcriptional regulator, glycine cleavage system transcriptional activator